MIAVCGGLYDGMQLPGDAGLPEIAFKVRGRGRGAVYNLDGTPHPDGPVSVNVRYELAQTVSGRLVYVPQDFYAEREEYARTDETAIDAPEGGDAAGYRTTDGAAG